MKDFRIIIAGGRDFTDYRFLKKKLNHLLKDKVSKGYNIIVISGKARGADSLGERYAHELGYKIEEYPANWSKHKKAAGYKRNVQMAEVANAVVVFWDGKSKGSKHMIDIADKYKHPLRVIHYEKEVNE